MVSSKRVRIVLLLGLNAVLFLALAARMMRPASAFAQSGAKPGDFLSFTAKVAGQSYDMLYILDVPARKLYGFYPTGGGTSRLVASPPRDLAKDFSRP